MNYSEPTCQVCYNKYDEQLRIPRIIPNCGHTLCAVCIMQMIDTNDPGRALACPFDKKKFFTRNDNIDNFPRNYSLIQILGDQKPDPRTICQIHDKKQDMFCMSHKVAVCEDCAKTPLHIGHEIRMKSELLQEINQKGNRLEEMITCISEIEGLTLKKINSEVTSRVKLFFAGLDKRVQEYIKVLESKRDELKNEIRENIAKHQMEVEERYQQFISRDEETKSILAWKEQAQRKVNQWKQLELNGTILEILQDQPEDLYGRVKRWETHIQEEFDLSEFLNNLETIRLQFNDDGIFGVLKTFGSVDRWEFHKKRREKSSDIKDIESYLRQEKLLREEEKEEEGPIFKLDKNFSSVFLQKQKEEAKQALEKMFSKNKISAQWVTKSSMEMLLVDKDIRKKSFYSSSFFPNKSNQKTLQTISALNIVCEKLDEELVKHLNDSLSLLHGLTSLKIQFNKGVSYIDITNQVTTGRFAPLISNIPSLQYLELNLENCSTIKDEGLRAIGGALSKIQGLVELYLRLPKFGIYTDSGLSDLGQGIMQLNSLKVLDIKIFRNIHVSTDRVSMVCSLITHNASLEVLRLNINELGSLTEAGATLIGQSLSKIANLKTLSFDLSVKDDTEVLYLAEVVSRLQNITTLELGMHDMVSVTSEKMGVLFDTLRNLQRLSKLHVGFEKWQLDGSNSIPKLGAAISQLQTLTGFSLHFQNCFPLSKKASEEFCASLRKMVNLTELVLKSNQMIDPRVSTLCSSLVPLVKIKRLHLDLKGCWQLSDSSLEALGDAIGKITRLNSLEVAFKECARITDKGIDEIVKGLSRKEEIESLSLAFLKCHVTDKSLVQLSRLINILGKLNKININLAECSEITDEGIKEMATTVSRIEGSRLAVIDLTFIACQKVSNKSKEILKDLRMTLEKKGVSSINIEQQLL